MDIKKMPDPLDDVSLAYLISVHDQENSMAWSQVHLLLTDSQLRQVLDTVSERNEKMWAEEYAAMSQDEKDDEFRGSAIYYARDHNFFTLKDEYEMVNRVGNFATSGINYLPEADDPELHRRLTRRVEYMSPGEKFTFYAGEDSFLASCFISPFTVDDDRFTSFLHYITYEKAKLFRDRNIYDDILKCTDQKRLKELNHAVKYFIDIVWDMMVPRIFRKGLQCKFSQNSNLYNELLNTSGTTIVLADDKEKVWSCGLGPDDKRINDRKQWTGMNLMGELITEIRSEFTGTY